MATNKTTEQNPTNGGTGNTGGYNRKETPKNPQGINYAVADVANDGFSEFEKATGEGAELQKIVDEYSEQGFIGVKADPRPNEDYTVAGVTRGLK